MGQLEGFKKELDRLVIPGADYELWADNFVEYLGKYGQDFPDLVQEFNSIVFRASDDSIDEPIDIEVFADAKQKALGVIDDMILRQKKDAGEGRNE